MGFSMAAWMAYEGYPEGGHSFMGLTTSEWYEVETWGWSQELLDKVQAWEEELIIGRVMEGPNRIAKQAKKEINELTRAAHSKIWSLYYDARESLKGAKGEVE